MSLNLTVTREVWPLADVFRISRGARTSSEVIVATITDGRATGRGECFPYARYGESLDSVEAQINSVASAIGDEAGRGGLARLLPPGAARNVVDCALWDLEAKRSGKRVWEIAGLGEPVSVTTVFTLGVDKPSEMAAKAAENKARPRLKLKMTGDGQDIDRVTAIHAASPDSGLVVDANEGWNADQYMEYAPRLAALGVEMIEQPLPANDDSDLVGIERPVPICADEACHDTASLGTISGKYDMINIKLDKTGGLTEALALRDAAMAQGYGIMVGCMIGTSLAMAPGLLVAQGAGIVDLDGPLLLARDREPGLSYRGSEILPPGSGLWG
ncbi:MAG: dipeptide epimerase [Rhodospirillaceae bacterium]|nr:dipeptide epimerase [Rhodospirillaceae bacterium]